MQHTREAYIYILKPWYKSEYISNNPALPSSNISRIQRNYKRTAILNKLFMRHITDMMATGEVASDIVGRGIQISRVQVAPDFNKINVFWLTKGIESDDEVEAILKQSAGQLRHELTQLHVIGVVPRIEFIKDKQYAKLVEVDRILATADFGEDYVPVNAGYSFTLNTKLPSEIEHHSEVPERPLPPMRMDVLGLKHDEIMTKVKKSLKKSRAPHRQKPSDHTAVQQDVSVRKEELTKFLTRRQFMQKERKNYSPELDL
ncbi:putative ribosome-binding factor A, mitochondrial isoform X2 [Periplaneta americana]|uniref:putative ribosome-binding factor A, mitochondrial isoform X2 n=1 Tax=Periplaneta americana TaxID=6978 RepID=UPI0037E87EFA